MCSVQFQNIKKILRELYERREKKILHLSLIQSRTNSNLTDTSALLENEKQFFHELTQLLNQYKDTTLTQLLHLSLPETHVVLRNPLSETHNPPVLEPVEVGAPLETPPEPSLTPESPGTIVQTHLTLRFKSAVPKFLGTELEIYGPYQPDDTAQLPAEIAHVLIQKGRAEEIQALELNQKAL